MPFFVLTDPTERKIPMNRTLLRRGVTVLTAAVLTAGVLASPLVNALDLAGLRPLGDLSGNHAVDAPDLTGLARHVARIDELPATLYTVSKDDLSGLAGAGGTIASVTTENGKMIVTYEDGRQVDFGTVAEENEEADGTILCHTTTAQITGTGAVQTGDEIRITAAGTYKISGNWEGRIVVSVGELDEVKLVLLGLTATCEKDSVLYVESADKVTVKNQKGYCNILRDTDRSVETETDTRGKAAIYARSSLEFSGAGTMVVSSSYKHAIACTKKLTIGNGSICATAVDCGLKGNNSVSIEGGNITVECGGQGIKVEDVNSEDKGYVEILGGELTIHSQETGIDATRLFEMSGGTVTVVTTGKTEADDAKGIKAGCAEVGTAALVNIYGGRLTVTSTDNALDSTGDMTIDGLADITLTSQDKGVQTSGDMTIGNGKLTVIQSTEGLESKGNMYIDGGTITVYATDDGISIGGTGKNLYVSGGVLDVTTASGDTDGIDSNGGMEVSGGFILVKGGSPNGPTSGSIDVERNITVTGGTIIALGGVCETPYNSAFYTAKFSNKSFSAGDYVFTVAGETVATFTLSGNFRGGWICSDVLSSGDACTVTRDGSTVASWTQTQKTQNVL